MIEAKVIVDGDYIHCNGVLIDQQKIDDAYLWIADGEMFETLQDAIKYCKEYSE